MFRLLGMLLGLVALVMVVGYGAVRWKVSEEVGNLFAQFRLFALRNDEACGPADGCCDKMGDPLVGSGAHVALSKFPVC